MPWSDLRATTLGALAALASAVLAAAPARADAIDGDWCRAEHNLSINGSDIRTPGGNRVQGEYDRHFFRYTAPLGEIGAGMEVFLVLRNEETLEFMRRLRGEAVYSSPEVWHRCKPIS